MTAELPDYILKGATFIGVAFAAFVANRSRVKVTATQTEIEGPGNEPSLRKLLKDQGAALVELSDKITKDFGAVHTEVAGLSLRLINVEKAVFSTLERRIGKVEDELFPGKRRVVRRLKP